MSEHSEDIDDIMRHYDSSNESEKREMFEDLLFSFYAKDDLHHYDNSNEAEKREMFEGLLLSFYAKGDEEASTFFFVLVSFWVIGGFFICNSFTITSQSSVHTLVADSLKLAVLGFLPLSLGR